MSNKMAGETIRITSEGLKDAAGVMDLLRYLGDDLQEKALKKGMVAAANHVKAQLVKRTPVRTGNLRDKMTVKPLRKRKGSRSIGYIVGASLDGLKTPYADGIDRPAYYLVMIENGYWSKRRIKRGRKDPNNLDYAQGAQYIPGRPFVQKSFDASVEGALKIVTDELTIFLGKRLK